MNQTKIDHVRISLVPISEISTFPQGDILYLSVRLDDPEVLAIKAILVAGGVVEPLVITSDGFIVSGRIRYAAAALAGLKEIPCRRISLERVNPNFLDLLLEAAVLRTRPNEKPPGGESALCSPAEGTTLTAHAELAATGSANQRVPFLQSVQRFIAGQRASRAFHRRRIHYRPIEAEPPFAYGGNETPPHSNDTAGSAALSGLQFDAQQRGAFNAGASELSMGGAN